MTSSAPPSEPILCNTTPTRYFAITDQIDLLIAVCGDTLRVPRSVLDPDEDPDGPADLLSEIGASMRFYAKRAVGAEAIERWFRLNDLRTRSNISVIEMTEQEMERFAELQSREIQRQFGLGARLGRGESAVIAIAEARGWVAAIDDWEAREVLHHVSPGTTMITSREIVRAAVYIGMIDTGEGDTLYQEMLDLGYRGPSNLWS